MDAAQEAGADDLQTDDPDVYEIYTRPDSFEGVRQALEAAKIATVEGKIDMIPANYVALDEAKSKQVMRLLEVLDDHEDTQNVWSNFDVPQEMMESA
jgi:transcriptional/translational regulatory protein YebC/TACO1